MKVALVSIGLCPSLALRNIRSYSLAHEEIRDAVEFELFDYDLHQFQHGRSAPSQQWSFVTRIDEAVDELVRAAPDVLAFSCYLWNIELSLHVAHLVKSLRPQLLTVFGGPDPGPRAERLLRRHAELDLVVEGDGEIPFLELLRCLLEGSPPDYSTVPSLHYRDGDRIAANQPSSVAPDLSLLAGVWNEPPSSAEIGRWFWPHPLYETLRGCPYSCSYCMYGKTPMNEKDPDLVVEELAGLLGRGLGVEIIDPTFTTYRNRAKKILRGLSGHDYTGGLSFEAYPDSIDREMAELMVAARVSQLGIGFQTISSQGLEAARRPENLERFERAVHLLQEHDVPFYIDVIYGLPRTTVDDFLATIDYLFSLGVSRPMVYRLLGLPGSPMMEEAERYEMVFSQSPPYELLSSSTFDLEDVIFCERFHRAYPEALRALGSDARRLADEAGGVSKLVRRYMKQEAEAGPMADSGRKAAESGPAVARA